MTILSQNTFFAVLLTVASYLIAAWLQRKTKWTFLSPVIIGALLVLPVLYLTGTDVDVYQSGVAPLSYLMTPATICLGLSLSEQLHKLNSDLFAILLGVAAGTAASLLTVLGLCALLGADHTVTVSLLPKSVTTAIGAVLSEEAGGAPSLTAAVIILTGNLGVLLGNLLCRLFRITDPIARGVAYGTASHVIGTSHALTESSLTGAVSSLSLTVAGLITAVVFPLLTA